MKQNTLGSRGPHVYVTRAATLEYQQLTRAQFETARKSLTTRLLSAIPDPERPKCYLLHAQTPEGMQLLRVYTEKEDGLLVVAKVVALS